MHTLCGPKASQHGYPNRRRAGYTMVAIRYQPGSRRRQGGVDTTCAWAITFGRY
jgi:hypothetical protein